MAPSPLLQLPQFLFFMLMAATSYGHDDINDREPFIIDRDFLNTICNQTWIPDLRYCQTSLSNSTVSEVLDMFLHMTEVATLLAADIAAGLNENSSLISPVGKQPLQKCQTDISNALDGIVAAIGDYRVYENVIDDILSAMSWSRSCQKEIQGITYFNGLGYQCQLITNLCNVSLTAARSIIYGKY